MASGFYLGGLGRGLARQDPIGFYTEQQNKQQDIQLNRDRLAQQAKLKQLGLAQTQITTNLEYVKQIVAQTIKAGKPASAAAKAIQPIIDATGQLAEKAGVPGGANRIAQIGQGLLAMPTSAVKSEAPKPTKIGVDPNTQEDIYGVYDPTQKAYVPVPTTGFDKPTPNNVGEVTGVSVDGQPTNMSARANEPVTGNRVADAFSALNQPPPSQQAITPKNRVPQSSLPPMSLTPDQAATRGVTGDDFLISTVPSHDWNLIQDLADYKIDPKSISIRKGRRQKVLGEVSQYTNHQYDQRYYPMMQQAIKEFNTGGSQSPATKITNGNTAIQHLGTLAEAVRELSQFPGFIGKMSQSGVPFFSYISRAVAQSAIKGTPLGTVLRKIDSARNKFAGEVAQFYSGSAGSNEAERERIIKEFDTALSLPELSATVSTNAELFQSKVNALQDRWKNAMAGPRFNDALLRNAMPDFPIIQQKTQQALIEIKGLQALSGMNEQTMPPAPSGGGWSIQRIQ